MRKTVQTSYTLLRLETCYERELATPYVATGVGRGAVQGVATLLSK